jgi:hypothetical protein
MVCEDTIVVNLREKGRIENEISGWRIYPYRDKSISFLPMVNFIYLRQKADFFTRRLMPKYTKLRGETHLKSTKNHSFVNTPNV